MPGKGWSGEDQAGSADQGALIALFPLCTKRRAHQSLKGPSLGDILACWVLFFTFSKIIIKQLNVVVEKLENVFLFLVVPCSLCHLLCWNTLVCTRVGVQCVYLSSVSQELQPVQSLWSARGQPSPLPWTGWKQVSIAPRRRHACCVLAQHHLFFPR